jgi:hypothetical protein
MQNMGDTILIGVITTSLPSPIITIPITLIRTATITIPIVKDKGNGMNTKALSTGGEVDILKGAVTTAVEAGTDVRRSRASSPHTVSEKP